MLFYYINLERRKDRNASMQTVLEKFLFPSSIVTRIEGVDREMYSSPEALAEYAVSLGYDRQFRPIFELGKKFPCTFLGLNLAYIQALERIANQSEVVWLAHDDWGPALPYDQYLKMLDEIPDFGAALLHWFTKDAVGPSYSESWAVGHRFGVDAVVFTPEVAGWAAEKFDNMASSFESWFHKELTSDPAAIRCYHAKDPVNLISRIEGHRINDCMVDTLWQGLWTRDTEGVWHRGDR